MKKKKIYKKLKKIFKKYGNNKIIYVKLKNPISIESAMKIGDKLCNTNIKHMRGTSELILLNNKEPVKEFMVFGTYMKYNGSASLWDNNFYEIII